MEIKDSYSFDELIEIIEILTGEKGCPWDKAQTHESIRGNMLEEAYEVVDAIDSGCIPDIIEELGDVLLQVVLHADIAKRANEFKLNDVISGLCKKLISRHTHIFGENHADSSDQALAFWQEAKSKEKKQHEGFPKSFPSLIRAQKIFKRYYKDRDHSELLNEYKDKDIGRALFDVAAVCHLTDKDAEIELNKYCKEIENENS